MLHPLKMTFAALLSAGVMTGAMAAQPLADATVARTDANRLAVRWQAKGPVDVYVSDKPDATVRTAKLASAADTDGQFDYAEPGAARSYFLLRERATGAQIRVAERLLPLAQGSNFRDLGGYPAAGGKRVRWGMIYRSGASPMLSDADIARIKALGLRDMIDLRSTEERQIAPTKMSGVRYSTIDYAMMTMTSPPAPANASTPAVPALRNGGDIYRKFPTFLAPQLRLVFSDLLTLQGPIAYNCTAGQDRTGFTTAIVLTALGVPRASILADYHLSTQFRQPQFEMGKITEAQAAASPVAALFASYQKNGVPTAATPLKTADGKAFLDSAFAEIESRWGSVDNYLATEVGLSKADIARLRATYLE